MMEIRILAVNDNGFEIFLTDGSVWQPENIEDITVTSHWYPPQRINVSVSSGKEYTLTNLDAWTRDQVKVSRIN